MTLTTEMGTATRCAVLVLLSTTVLATMTVASSDAQCDDNTRMSAQMSRLEERLAVMELQNRMAEMESRMSRVERESSNKPRTSSTKAESGSFKSASEEDRDCRPAVQACQCPQNSTDMTSTLEVLTTRLAGLISALDEKRLTGNDTCTQSQTEVDDSHQENQTVTVACERGMAGSTTAVNEPFVITYEQRVGKEIRCDAQTDGGGWVVIQRRAEGDVDFYRTWAEYRDGFGNLTTDFWLGNEAVHNLTNETPHELRIDFVINGENRYAWYSSFKIESEADKYRLHLGSYSGTVGDTGTGLSYSNGAVFSTKDVDNNGYHLGNCAVVCRAAWWYKACHRANLNGPWSSTTTVNRIRWHTGKGWVYPTFMEMKIRRI